MQRYIKETFENATTETVFGEGPMLKVDADSLGELFRSLRAEYGRCEGYIYTQQPDYIARVGWTFLKRDTYQRSKETYLRRVWVEVYEQEFDGAPLFLSNVAKPITTH